MSTFSVAVERGSAIELPTGLYIGGEWVEGTGELLEVFNPATEESLGKVHTASKEDVDRAVVVARKAFETTWGTNVAPTERGRLLFKLADLIEQNIDEIVLVEAADGGKPYQWAMADVKSSLAAMRYFAGAADKVTGATIELSDNTRQVNVRREPIGVVGQICPWNFSIMMMAWKIAPALASGCSILFKSAENTPLGPIIITKFLEQAGYPKGAFNLLTGLGPIAGQAIAEHMDIDKIAFTGSTAIGRRIAATAAMSNLKVVTLELGGKSPNVVFESANLQQAARWAAFGLFETSGQSCIVGSRILVQESVYDEFLKIYIETVKGIRVGKDKEAFYGSLISKVQFDKVLGYIEVGKTEAKLETGGARHGTKGFFVQPTVFSGVTMDMKIAREEIFGPVSCVIKFKTEEEAIRLANDTSYGLAGAIHTTDANQVPRVTRQIKAGTVWVNTYSPLSPQVPFGGMKASGHGRELSMAGLEAYYTTKAVHHYYGPDLEWPFVL